MRMSKKWQRLLLSSLAVGAVTFTPVIYNFDGSQFPVVVSVAHAEVKTYVGVDTAMCDFGEDDPEMVKMIQAAAQSRAIQAAKEKAGVYIKSYTKSINAIVTEDSISTMTNMIVDVLDVKFEKKPYEAYQANGESYDKIGFMYEATVTVNIDTTSIDDYLNLDYESQTTLESQNKNLEKSIAKNNEKIKEIEKNSIYAKTEAEQNEVKAELDKSHNELLINQKLEEGNKLYYKKHYKDAISKYTEIIQINPNYADAYYYRGLAYYFSRVNDHNHKRISDNYKQARSDFYKAIQLDPDGAFYLAYYVRGEDYFKSRNYEQAIADFDKAIQIVPVDPFVYNYRGLAYIELTYKDDEFYAIRPIRIKRQDNALNIDYLEKAIESFTMAILLDTECPNPKWRFKFAPEYYTRRGNAYGDLADVYINGYRYNDYKKPDEISDKNHSIAINYMEKAIDDYDKAIKFDSRYEQAAYDGRKRTFRVLAELYADMLYKMPYKIDTASLEKAIAIFDKAIKLEPKDYRYYKYRGDAYESLGNNTKAQADFAKAKELGYEE